MNIGRVCLISNCRARVAFVANQQGVFQVSFFSSCDYFSLENCLKVFFVYFLARCLSATHSSAAQTAFMDVHEIWDGGIPDYTGDVLFRSYRYKHVIASYVRIAIYVEGLRILIVEPTVAGWKQSRLG